MRFERLRWREVRSTTPFRLTLWLGGLSLIGLWATLGASYLFTARELTARSDRILFAWAQSMLEEAPARLPARIHAQIADAAPGLSYFALESRDGDLVEGNIRVAKGTRPDHPFNLAARPGRHGPVRVLAVRTPHGETIVLGRDITQIHELRRRLLMILLASGVGGTILVLAAATLLSLAPLRRVRDLERASRAIAEGQLGVRMPIAGRHDELDQFAVTVNLMLDEVAHVVAQVKTATDAIAHDLRTPLTRVRATLHRTLHAEDLPMRDAAIVGRAVADLDAVIERFGALLRIAELEAGGRRIGLRALDPASVLEELLELYGPLAEERGVALSLSAGACPPIHADRELLFEAIANLIDNAIKFARSTISLSCRGDDTGALIEVTDDGAGIPPDERDAVFRRFHRARGAAGVEGTGLGLAVVSAIAHLHGFAVELDDAAPGLIVRIRIAAPAT